MSSRPQCGHQDGIPQTSFNKSAERLRRGVRESVFRRGGGTVAPLLVDARSDNILLYWCPKGGRKSVCEPSAEILSNGISEWGIRRRRMYSIAVPVHIGEQHRHGQGKRDILGFAGPLPPRSAMSPKGRM